MQKYSQPKQAKVKKKKKKTPRTFSVTEKMKNAAKRERKRVHYFGANLVYCAAAATTLNHEDDYITGRGACFRIYACGVQASGHGACVFVWSLDL